MTSHPKVVSNKVLWDQFIEANEPRVRRLNLPPVSQGSPNSIVMIEPRSHPHFEFVLRSALFFLGPGWGVELFVGEQNLEFVRRFTDDLGGVVIHQISTPNLSAPAYNALKKRPDFWESISAENILWLEPDCLICRRGISPYMKYDFIGAPWHPVMSPSPSCRIGNGGLSFRKKSAMLRVARECNRSNDLIATEDVFFAINMVLANQALPGSFKLPTVNVAKTFAVEAVYFPQPLGLHKAWRYLQPDALKRLLDTIDYREDLTE